MSAVNKIYYNGTGSLVTYNGYDTKAYYDGENVYGEILEEIDWDLDALDFVTSGSINGYNQQVAINNLTKTLKTGSNLWDDLEFVWPFAGTFAQTRNLKAYSNNGLVFGSALTSGSLGITGDGTSNSYASTGIQSVFASIGYNTYGLFVVDNIAENAVDFGAFNSSVDKEIYLKTQTSSPYVDAETSVDTAGVGPISSAVTSSRGFTISAHDRVADEIYLYKEGSLLISGSSTGPRFLPDNNATYAIGAYATSDSSWEQNASKTYGFGFYTDILLTPARISELNTAVQSYILTLNR